MLCRKSQTAEVVRNVDCVVPQRLERDDLQGASVRAGQYHRCGAAVLVSAKPVPRGDTPPVAGHQAGESVLRHRCGQVVADRALMLEEVRGHDGADDVQADVLRTGRAAAVSVEAGDRVGATRFQLATEHVAISHRPIIGCGPANCDTPDARRRPR